MPYAAMPSARGTHRSNHDTAEAGKRRKSPPVDAILKRLALKGQLTSEVPNTANERGSHSLRRKAADAPPVEEPNDVNAHRRGCG